MTRQEFLNKWRYTITDDHGYYNGSKDTLNERNEILFWDAQDNFVFISRLQVDRILSYIDFYKDYINNVDSWGENND